MKHIQEVLFLLGSLGFVVGLKMMGKPDSARKGNLVAAAGMLFAVLGIMFFKHGEEGIHLVNNIGLITAGIGVGTLVGWLMAKKVQMTAMPEMVSLFNGMGGLCAALISLLEWQFKGDSIATMPAGEYLAIIAGLIIGTVSFVGSIVAWGKLSGKLGDFRFPGQQFINIIMLLAIVGAAWLNFGAAAEGSMIYF